MSENVRVTETDKPDKQLSKNRSDKLLVSGAASENKSKISLPVSRSLNLKENSVRASKKSLPRFDLGQQR